MTLILLNTYQHVFTNYDVRRRGGGPKWFTYITIQLDIPPLSYIHCILRFSPEYSFLFGTLWFSSNGEYTLMGEYVDLGKIWKRDSSHR